MTVSTWYSFFSRISRTAGPERSSRWPLETPSEQVITRALITDAYCMVPWFLGCWVAEPTQSPSNPVTELPVKRSDFFYELPPELIAQEPRERGRSRMMVVTPPDRIEHDNFANFPDRLHGDDVLVINDTRVIPARLFAEPKGAMRRPIEVLLVR